MPHPLSIALIATLCLATTARADDKPSPAVKAILDQAVVEVRKNHEELDKANKKPLDDAREELQVLFQKLVDSGRSADAQAVLKQIETLQADVLRMASDGERPTLMPAVKAILEKAVGKVRTNRTAFDKANRKPLESARRELQDLAKKQSDEGKTQEASATLKQIEKLTSDVLRLAAAPSPGPAVRDGAEEWKGHRYKVFKEALSWHDAKKKCEELGGHLVIIDGADEQQWLLQLLGRSGLSVNNSGSDWACVNVGASDEASEGTWTWVDGSPLKYQRWGRQQPDNFARTSHFLGISIHRGGAWDDVSNEGAVGFICEWDG